MTGSDVWRWVTASDPSEAHALLLACDQYHATPEMPAPVRTQETTARRVAAGAVHMLRRGDRCVAMFTLTWEPPFELSKAGFPEAQRPAYVSRLAVLPSAMREGTVLGARCYRRAFELASAGGADVIRLEANPDLVRVVGLLSVLDFEACSGYADEAGRRRVYLQRTLTPET